MRISIGFEFETQAICMVTSYEAQQQQTRIIHQPKKLVKTSLEKVENKIVEIYPDDLKRSTAFYENRIQPFVSSIHTKRTINFDAFDQKFVIHLGDDSDNVYDFFSHAEFIVTYPQIQEISLSNTSLLNHILEKAKDAVLDINNAMNTKFCRAIRIELSHKAKFPYDWITQSKRNNNIVLFFQEDPVKNFMSKFRFVVQTTLGIPIQDAPNVMKLLTTAFIESGGNPSYDKIQETNKYANTIYKKFKHHWKTEDIEILRSFLFLLFYSALTAHSRKSKALFVIRCTMFEIAMSEISEPDLDLLELVLLDIFFDDPVGVYISNIFKDLHHAITTYERRLRQNMVDVTTIPYNKSLKMVYIEFRGFRTVLMKQCKGSHPNSNLYLNDLLMCKPFR